MPLPKKLFSVLDLPVLTALLREAELTFVDVGGRGEAFYPLVTLAPFASYVVSEPDPAEAVRLQEQLPRESAWRSVTVFADAIASSSDARQLHITAEPGMSSLLLPNAEVTGKYYVAPKFEVVSTIDVRCVTLDQAASRYGFEDAAFLKLDTQGTELDILRSGGQLMASLLGIHLEVSFQPFYSGQAIFHDVDAYLVQQGFTLRALNRTMLRRAGYRATIYSKRDVTWAHCLYLREPAAIGGNPRVPQRPLSRLLGLTVAFQYFDLAMEIAAALGRDWLNAADAQQLLVEIEQASEISHRHLAWKRERSDADPKRAAAELLAASVRDKSLID